MRSMRREVTLENIEIVITSDTGRFSQRIAEGSAKEVGEAFAKIAKYLKSANHVKTGLNNITLVLKQEVYL